MSLFQVELHVTKIHCISKAAVQLPINLEDAARSELDFQKGEQVMYLMHLVCMIIFFCVSMSSHPVITVLQQGQGRVSLRFF